MKSNSYSFKTGAYAFLFSLVGMLVVSLIFSNVIILISQNYSISIEQIQNLNWVQYLNIILSELTFFIVFLSLNLYNKKNVNVFKASKLKIKFDYKILLLTIALSLICFFSSINITGLVNYGFSFISSIKLNSSLGISLNNFGEFLLVLFLLAILPAIFEELVFRGIIYNSLRQKFSLKISILVSAIMFALIHFSIYKTFFQFILGTMLGILVYLTGTIVYGIVFHFINNASIVLINYIFAGKPVLEFQIWGVKEIILSILIFAIGVTIIVLLFMYLKKYTAKHKNYFDLEKTENPLYSNNENSSNNVNEKLLSNYEKKIIKNQQNIDGMGVFSLSIFFALMIWSICSFGGFV